MRSILYRTILILLFGGLALGACGRDEETPTPAPPATPVVQESAPTAQAPTAQVSPLSASESPLSAPESPLATPAAIAPGKALVVGRLFSQGSGQPLNHAVVRLAEIYCPEGTKDEDKSEECFWALDNAFSPSTFTDETGYFEFVDVEARDYVVMVGDYIGKYAFVEDDESKPIIVTAPADEVTVVGEHYVAY